MRRKANSSVIREIESLKNRMQEGFALETKEDTLWTVLADYSLTEVKLTSERGTLLNLSILHTSKSKENNILANAALQIIQTFAKEEETE